MPARAAIVVDPMSIGATNVSFGNFNPIFPVTNPVPDPLSPPQGTSVLMIGRTSPGWLEINGGSKTNLQSVVVAGDPSATGRLIVTGSGSELNAGSVILGSSESGLLELSNGAAAHVNSLTLHSTPAGISSVLIMSGSGTVVEAQETVSVRGTSQIHTSGGALLKADDIYVGQFPGQEGEVAEANVFGLSTKWQILNELHVGDSGPGKLTITGSEILAGQTYLGGLGPSAALSLANATLRTDELYVATDSISGSGSVTTKGIIADLPLVFDATHGLQQDIPIAGQPLAKIALDHSQPAKLGAGFQGHGSVSISAGSVVRSSFGMLGYGLGSFGQASVTAAGSKWQIDNQLDVGYQGAGELTIGAGASVEVEFDIYLDRVHENAPSRIEFNGGELSARLLHACTDQLRGTGTIHADGFHLDGNLILDQPGTVPPDLVLDDLPGQHVTIDFNTPGWGEVGIGCRHAGSLQIRNGAKLVSSAGQLGGEFESRGTAIVEGPGSEWKLPEGLLRIGTGGATGELRVADGGFVESQRVSIESNGTLEVTGPSTQVRTQQLEFARYGYAIPTIHVHSGGVLQAESAYAYNGGILTVAGEGSLFSLLSGNLNGMLVHVRDGGTLALESEFGPGSLGFVGTALHLDGGTIEANGGDIDIDSGALLFESGTLRNFSRYEGNLWQTAGRVELNAPQATIVGTYYQDADATIQLTLTTGPRTPSLQVQGTAILSGTLEVVAPSQLPTQPQVNGAAYLVLETQYGISGQFEHYLLPELATGLAWSVIQNPSEIWLQVIAGDYNGNGIVDAADYAVWRNSENQSVEPGTGADGDRDGYISYNDYSIWRRFFGQRIVKSMGSAAASPGTSASSTFAVPEPSGATLLLVIVVHCSLSRYRQQPARKRSREIT